MQHLLDLDRMSLILTFSYFNQLKQKVHTRHYQIYDIRKKYTTSLVYHMTHTDLALNKADRVAGKYFIETAANSESSQICHIFSRRSHSLGVGWEGGVNEGLNL